MPRTTPVVKIKNIAIPAIGLGTWQLKGRECRDVVRRALDEGYVWHRS